VKAADSDAAIAVGSMVDWETVYNREPTTTNETFGVEGNYFKLNCAGLTNVVRPSDGIIWSLNKNPQTQKDEWTFIQGKDPMSHSQLIFVGLEGPNTKLGNITYTQNNISVIGNDKVSGDSQLGCGGIIFLKGCANSEISVSNNIAINWFISYMGLTDCTKYAIEKTKGYDNYNSFLYNYGNKTMEVTDSEFENCGGPVFLADHVNPKAYGNKYAPKITYKNTKGHSYVAGDEAWFIATGAVAYAAQIQQLAVLLASYGTKITKNISGVDKFDCAGVMKLEGFNAETSTSSPSSGLFVADEVNVIDYEDTTIKAVISQPQLVQAPVFVQPKTGVISVFNGQALINPLTGEATQPNQLNGGDYVTIYLPGGVGARISIMFNIQK
ncbi:MAG: hypothetical protein RSA18_03390, partial [Bacilli bacterium]